MVRQRLFNAAAASALMLGLGGCESMFGGTHMVKVTPVPVDAPPRALGAAEDDLYARAKTAIDQRDYGLALDVLQVARQTRPDDPRVLTAMGVVYDKLGRFDLSRQYYDRAEAADPGSRVVAADRAYSEVLQGLNTGRTAPAGAAPALASNRPVTAAPNRPALGPTPAAAVNSAPAVQPVPPPTYASAVSAASATPVAAPAALTAYTEVSLDQLAHHAASDAVATAVDEPHAAPPSAPGVSLEALARTPIVGLNAAPAQVSVYASAGEAPAATAVRLSDIAVRTLPPISLDALSLVSSTNLAQEPGARGDAMASAAPRHTTALQVRPVAHHALAPIPAAALYPVARPVSVRAEVATPSVALPAVSWAQAAPPPYAYEGSTAHTVPSRAVARGAPTIADARAVAGRAQTTPRLARVLGATPELRLEAPAPAPALHIATAAQGAALHVEEPVSYLLHIENASGEAFAANTVRDRLADRGWRMAHTTPRHGQMLTASFLRYPPSHRRIAHALARTLTFPVRLESCAGCSRMTLVVGSDAGHWAKRQPVRRA